jgi:hypothetical protein
VHHNRIAPAGPPRRGTALIALLAAGLALTLLAACGVLLLLTRDWRQAVYGGGGTVAALACLAVGLLVAQRQPGSPIGWLLLGWALVVPVTGIALLYSVLDYRDHHDTLPFGPAALLTEPAPFLIAVVSALAVLLFPDGRLPSRRWRPVLWIFLAAGGIYLACQFTGQALAIGRRPLRIGPDGVPLRGPDQALVSAWAAGRALNDLGWIAAGLILACWLVFLGRQAASYREAVGDRRQQLKWLLAGAACCVVATAITFFTGGHTSGAAQAVQDGADLGAAALPAGIGVGIVRYRLYNVGRIISRTLAYAIVTGLLVGVYAALVLLASLVLPSSSPVAVAGSTLAVAALFQPLRRRVQRAVDRRFNRSRYDNDRIVAAFAARLQDATDLGVIRDDLARTVNGALEPTYLSVWSEPGFVHSSHLTLLQPPPSLVADAQCHDSSAGRYSRASPQRRA